MNEIDFEFERDEPVEYKLSREELSQAVLFNTDWTVETAVSQLTKENISLDPSFQRRDAWRIEKKSRFIESLLLGLPVPQIVLAEDRSRRGQFIVLDGKQRLLTLLQFSGHAHESSFNGFKLKDLQFLAQLDGKNLESLKSNSAYEQDVRAFLNYPIRSSIIRNWPNTKYLETVFIRLNEGSLKLSPQELRQALVPGEFSTFIDKFASESIPLQKLLHNRGPDFRMRDTELLLRFVGFSMFPDLYAGDMKGFLDSVTEKLNASWLQISNQVIATVREIDEAIDFGLTYLTDRRFAKKWDVKTKNFSTSLNRAVAEIEVFYFKDRNVKDWIKGNSDEFADLISSLTTNDNDFRGSLEATTKSLTAVGKRFETLGNAIQAKIKHPLRILRLTNGRLSE